MRPDKLRGPCDEVRRQGSRGGTVCGEEEGQEDDATIQGLVVRTQVWATRSKDLACRRDTEESMNEDMQRESFGVRMET